MPSHLSQSRNDRSVLDRFLGLTLGGFRRTATTVSINTGPSMELLDQLPHRFRRRYLPESLEFERWNRLGPFFQVLEERELDSVEQLEQWLLDWSELSDAVGEEGSLRYIRMTCDTENPEIEKAYIHFLEEIAENLKAADDRLKRCFLGSPARKQLPSRRYSVLDRHLQNDVDLFREANIALETRESKGTQRYQKLIGSLTVSFEGRDQTLQQMKRYLEYPERRRREAAWKAVVERRLSERDRLEELFEELLGIRSSIAANAGFDSYRDYMFRRLERFDYGPEDCYRFHQGVESVVVPLVRKLQRLRAEEMGLASLRPWDLSVDPQGRPPLRPFAQTGELVDGCVEITGRVDARFARFLEAMRSHGLLNLDSRKGKAPGGYQSTLEEARLPFIFMNAVGVDGDVRTLLHEAGHAFHVFATQEEALGDYRHGPIEFCEVASMSMELLGGEHLEVFYNRDEDLKRSRRNHLEGIVEILAWIAQVDAFQHWIYTHPGHSPAQRRDQWVALNQRFGGIEDWSGFEEALRCGWHRQLHIFELPFYYIEYAIAQLGALQVWLNSKRDLKRAVDDYWAALQLGGSRPLPELFRRAGAAFDFGPATLKPLMERVEAELEAL